MVDKSLFKKSSLPEETGLRIFLKNDKWIDITSFLQFSKTDDITINASQRDLTINSIYFNILARTIEDPLNGVDDLINGVLRTCAVPSYTFAINPIHILRVIRFASFFHFSNAESILSEAFPFKSVLCRVPLLPSFIRELEKWKSREDKLIIFNLLFGANLLDSIFDPQSILHLKPSNGINRIRTAVSRGADKLYTLIAALYLDSDVILNKQIQLSCFSLFKDSKFSSVIETALTLTEATLFLEQNLSVLTSELSILFLKKARLKWKYVKFLVPEEKFLYFCDTFEPFILSDEKCKICLKRMGKEKSKKEYRKFWKKIINYLKSQEMEESLINTSFK